MNPNVTYSGDGVRMSANDFMNFAEIALEYPFWPDPEIFCPIYEIKGGLWDLSLFPQDIIKEESFTEADLNAIRAKIAEISCHWALWHVLI